MLNGYLFEVEVYHLNTFKSVVRLKGSLKFMILTNQLTYFIFVLIWPHVSSDLSYCYRRIKFKLCTKWFSYLVKMSNFEFEIKGKISKRNGHIYLRMFKGAPVSSVLQLNVMAFFPHDI